MFTRQNDGSDAATPDDRDQRLPSNVTALAGRTLVPIKGGRTWLRRTQ
jgi:hypothetical protein